MRALEPWYEQLRSIGIVLGVLRIP